ncbi:MAG: phosphotransferase [Gammaproteobacteria bacterium]
MSSSGSPKTADLARALATSIDDGVAILDRHALPYRSTFPLEVLSVRMSDGTERSLVFKDLSRRGPTDLVWQVKAPFLHDPRREIEVYRDVLAPGGLTAPECVAVVIEPDLGRYWLFLEKVEGELLWQIGDLEVWRAAARWLADMHAHFADRTRALPLRLLVHDREYHRRWIDRASRFARPPESGNGDRRDFDWLAERYLQVVDWMVEQPTTFLHGEFYPSNIVIESTDGGFRVRPVDWEMAAVGPGLLDLAALASGAWGQREREALASAYREALPPQLRPSLETLRDGLDRCRLLLAVQWLGWSADWTPPEEHAHDWISTAIELAEVVEP